jgi:hypothetical protein
MCPMYIIASLHMYIYIYIYTHACLMNASGITCGSTCTRILYIRTMHRCTRTVANHIPPALPRSLSNRSSALDLPIAQPVRHALYNLLEPRRQIVVMGPSIFYHVILAFRAITTLLCTYRNLTANILVSKRG